jgi:hypothetical protein
MKIAGGAESELGCWWSVAVLPSAGNCLPVSHVRLGSRVAAFFVTACDVAAIAFGNVVGFAASVEYSTMFCA